MPDLWAATLSLHSRNALASGMEFVYSFARSCMAFMPSGVEANS